MRLSKTEESLLSRLKSSPRGIVSVTAESHLNRKRHKYQWLGGREYDALQGLIKKGLAEKISFERDGHYFTLTAKLKVEVIDEKD